MTSPQKAKGSGWERDIAKFLSSLYNEHFLRAPSSGAYIGGINIVRKQQLSEAQARNFKGDIVPGDSFPKMNAEAKFYADFSFNLLFTGQNKQLDSWIEQAIVVADPTDFTILFLKFNRKGSYVVVKPNKAFTLQNHFTYNSPTVGDWIMMDLELFFKLNADKVKKLCK